eukprot:988144-Pelagomonas_calceolata.AAC.4
MPAYCKTATLHQMHSSRSQQYSSCSKLRATSFEAALASLTSTCTSSPNGQAILGAFPNNANKCNHPI